MKGVDFDQANMKLKGNSPNVNDLIAGRATNDHGERCLVAKFELTEEEKKNIKDNGFIYLTILGQHWPPVSIDTVDPYKAYGYIPTYPTGMPECKHKGAIQELFEKVFKKPMKMSNPEFEDFLGMMNLTMPMGFMEIGEKIEKAKNIEKIMVSTSLMGLEKMLVGNLGIADSFLKENRNAK